MAMSEYSLAATSAYSLSNSAKCFKMDTLSVLAWNRLHWHRRWYGWFRIVILVSGDTAAALCCCQFNCIR